MPPANLLSQKCSATSKRTGQPCRAWAIAGGKVCWHHGGSIRAVRAAADRRLALAEAMARGDRRHPAEILLDTLHASDVLLRRSIEAGGSTPEELATVVDHLERAQRFARSVLDLNIADRQQRLAEEKWKPRAELIAGVIERVLDRLGVDWRRNEVRTIVAKELRRDPAPEPLAITAGGEPS